MTALPFVAMLPLKTTGGHYDENIDRLKIMLDSFERFFDLPEPLTLFLVCIARELPAARAALVPRWGRVSIEFVAEDDVVPGIGAHRAIGWYKQQALKLAFAAASPAPFMLSLDPDILLCRPMRAEHLVADGRCYTSWMSKTEHPHWWAASSGLLGVSPDPTRKGLNVTPNMLARAIAEPLGPALSRRLDSPAPWIALLDVNARWTEYTLYSVFAESTGLLDAHHRADLPDARRLLGRSVWTPANIENYSLSEIHEAPDGAFFTVCASHTGVSAATLRGLYDAMLLRTALRAA